MPGEHQRPVNVTPTVSRHVGHCLKNTSTNRAKRDMPAELILQFGRKFLDSVCLGELGDALARNAREIRSLVLRRIEPYRDGHDGQRRQRRRAPNDAALPPRAKPGRQSGDLSRTARRPRAAFVCHAGYPLTWRLGTSRWRYSWCARFFGGSRRRHSVGFAQQAISIENGKLPAADANQLFQL